MDAQTIRSSLSQYLDKLKSQINIQKAILYGSVATGTATDTSDVDLLILSEDFSNLDYDERSKLLYRTSVGFPYDLHVYGTTPTEFAQASALTSLGQIRQSKDVIVL